MVAESDGDTSGLKAVAGRSGDLEVFDRRQLDVMRWAAVRYVAPLSALLGKATPPNVPRRPKAGTWGPVGRTDGASTFGSAIAGGKRPPSEVWVGSGSWAERIAADLAPVADAGRSGLVVTPTAAEGELLATDLRALLGDRVMSVFPDRSAADQTKSWGLGATRPGTVVVGTRGIAFWTVAEPGAAWVVGEGRKGMKDKATPTTHARDVLVRRSQVERFGLVLAGTVPSAEALALAAVRHAPGGLRPWGLVEVVDRRREEEYGQLIGAVARSALRAAAAEGRSVLVFTHRRTTAQRCARCRSLRTCSTCGSGAFDGGSCERCETPSTECADCGFGRFEMMGSGASRVAAEVGRIVGRDAVGDPGSGRPIIIGTERDLPGLAVDLTIIVDADGPLLAPTYRAVEDGLRLLARAVAAAGRGRGRRGLVQTANPGHPAIVALRKADPAQLVATDAADRVAAGFPPGGEVLVLEIEDAPRLASAELEEAIGSRAQVLGPAEHHGRQRWLLQGPDLTAGRIAVRGLVARWREGGARVRIDADPIDL